MMCRACPANFFSGSDGISGAASLRLRGGQTTVHGALIDENADDSSSAAPPGIHAKSGRAQKPSSARPIQLNANRQKTAAVTDAKVVIVLADSMTKTLCWLPGHPAQRLVLKHGRNSPG